MRAMLPTKDLPQGMVFKQRCPMEIPLVRDEEIYRITGDESEKFDSYDDVAKAKQQEWTEFAVLCGFCNSDRGG